MRLFPLVNGVMEHHDLNSIYPDCLVRVQRIEILPKLRTCQHCVMITEDEVFISIQPPQHFLRILRASEGEVPTVVDSIPFLDN
ncbi:hypothetical protein D3C78_1430570 [compost metagenome]